MQQLPKPRLLALSAVSLLTAIVLAAALAGSESSNAHTGHPQKKLFTGAWHHQLVDDNYGPWMDLITSKTFLECDNNNAGNSCGSKWSSPASAATSDWNNQPTTVNFKVQPDQNAFDDVHIHIIDEFTGSPGLIGLGLVYDVNQDLCDHNSCSYYYADAVIADDATTGQLATTAGRRGIIIHELGHIINLRHESVNADESVRYECGFDNTGPIPHSVMAYDCIFPPSSGGLAEWYVHEWDTCGVNHKYYDPTYDYSECACLPSSTFSGSPPTPGPLSYYHPLTPSRILDTRTGVGVGGAAGIGRLGGGCAIGVQITGQGGVPPSGVSAVVMNVTVTKPNKESYLTVYPSGTLRPVASNLNFKSGQTVPNLVTVKLGTGGKVNVYNNAGQTHVIFDVVGWYDSTPAAPPAFGEIGGGPTSHDGNTPDAVSIDMDTTGNGANALGTNDQCARIDQSASGIVDVTVGGVPAYVDNAPLGVVDPSDTGGIVSFSYEFQFPADITVNATPEHEFLVNSNPGSAIFNASDATPDASSPWTGTVLDTGTGVPESGSGVLTRLTIAVGAAAPNGQYLLSLTNHAVGASEGNFYTPHTTNFANVAVGQNCGPLVTPAPTPSPSPTPTTSPTATPSATPTPTPDPNATYGHYHPLTPARILDTRDGTGQPGPGTVGPGETITVDVTNQGGVPALGVTAVAVNVTVTGPTATSYLTVFPANPRPTASNLNFVLNQTVANLVIVKVGSDGNIRIYNNAGDVHVIADVVGWFGDNSAGASRFRALSPVRILDTRSSPQSVPPGTVGPGESVLVDVTGLGGVPPSGVTAVIVNVTATQPTASSYLTVYPSDAALPDASNLNFVAGKTVPNLVIVKVGATGVDAGKVRVYNNLGQVQVIFDVVGFFVLSPP